MYGFYEAVFLVLRTTAISYYRFRISWAFPQVPDFHPEADSLFTAMNNLAAEQRGIPGIAITGVRQAVSGRAGRSDLAPEL